MKKSIYYTVFAVFLTAGILTSCESDSKKADNAQENVKDEKLELSAEYIEFKADAEIKINDNEKRIAELKIKLNKPGLALLIENRKKRIEELEQKNAELRNKLIIYEKEHSDWETFKNEFNHDMDALGEAIKDLFKNNKD